MNKYAIKYHKRQKTLGGLHGKVQRPAAGLSGPF